MDCPSEEELALLSSGAALPLVARHRDACPACAAVVDALKASEGALLLPRREVSEIEEPVPGASIGRYVVLRRLGRGGMGVVFLAYDTLRDRTVALKLMRADGAGPAPSSARVLQLKGEFRLARDLHHPNLVRLGDLFAESERWFFTMELIHGVDLLSYVGRERCDVDRLRATLIQLVRGLSALHRAGLLHRDVKPDNVLVEPSGRTILVDFGLAIEQAEAAPRAGRVTGTIPFMAPEQIRGDAIGPAADWYAVGAVLFTALTGRPPFSGNPAEVMAGKTGSNGPKPSSVTGGIPPELDSLCERLLSLDPAVRPSGDEILRALAAAPEPAEPPPAPFVGRDRWLSELTGHLQESRSRPVVVTLEGEAGIGKTTLAARAIAVFRDANPALVVLRGRCHAREAIPYNAIDGAIDDLERELDRVDGAERARIGGRELADLCRLFPTLSVDEPAITAATDPIATRRRAFVALREVLHRLAHKRPVVLMIDDLQWADRDSLAALEALLAAPAPPACLLLCTVRTSETQPWRPPAGLEGAIRCQVEGLGTQAVAAIAGALGRGDVDPVRLCEETAGNPMLLEQWLTLPCGAGAAPPPTLGAVLAARTASLSPAALAVLEALVVAGRAVSHPVAAAAAAADPDALDRAIAELVATRFARRDGTRIDVLDVFHERIRDELYRSLGLERGQLLHGRLAEALIATGGPPDAIAHQLLLAGRPEPAARYFCIAAEAAARALAFDRAAILYREALGTAAEHRVPALRVELAGALAGAGRPRESGEAYLAAAAVSSLAAERLELRRRAAEQFLAGGYLERGLAEARAILAETGGGRLPRSDAAALTTLLVHRAQLATRRLTWRPRPEHELPQEVRTRLDLHWSLSIGLASVDSLRGAVFATRLPLLCLDHGDELRIARALCAAAFSYAGMGLERPALRLIAAAARAAESLQSPLAHFYAGLGRLAFDFLIENDWRATRKASERLTFLWHQAGRGRGWELDSLEQLACYADLWMGRLREVQRRVATLSDHAADAGNRFQEVGLRTYFGVIESLLGDPVTSERQVLDAMARAHGEQSSIHQAYWAVRSRTYAAMYRGDVEQVSGALDPAWRRLPMSLLLRVPTVAAEARAAIGSYQVTRAALARSPADRRMHLAAARRVAERVRRTPSLASRTAYLTLATGIAHLEGADDRALALLRTAESTYAAAGMDGQLAAARLRLAALLGGDEGDRLRARALAWFAEQRIPDPERTAALLSPGWHPDA